MEHTALLYFVGPAGAGKSTLVATLQEWMQHYRYDGIAVNLDPGAESMPYTFLMKPIRKFGGVSQSKGTFSFLWSAMPAISMSEFFFAQTKSNY